METQAKAGQAETSRDINANAANRTEGCPEDPDVGIGGAGHHGRRINESASHQDIEHGQGNDNEKDEHREFCSQDPGKEDSASQERAQEVREDSPSQQGDNANNGRSDLKEPPPEGTEEPKGDECGKDDQDCSGDVEVFDAYIDVQADTLEVAADGWQENLEGEVGGGSKGCME